MLRASRSGQSEWSGPEDDASARRQGAWGMFQTPTTYGSQGAVSVPAASPSPGDLTESTESPALQVGPRVTHAESENHR